MGDARPLLAAVCAAIVLGAVIVTRALLIGTLEGGAELVDANLGTALARPLVLQAANLCLGAALLQAFIVVRGIPRSTHATIALLLVATAGLERAWAAPAMYAAWTRVDRLAGQPVSRFEEARAAALQHEGILLALGTLALVSIWLSLRGAASGPPTQA